MTPYTIPVLYILLAAPMPGSGWGLTIEWMRQNSDSLTGFGCLFAGAVAGIFMSIIDGENITVSRGFMRLFITVVIGFALYYVFMNSTGMKQEMGYAIATIGGFVGYKRAKLLWKKADKAKSMQDLLDTNNTKDTPNDH